MNSILGTTRSWLSTGPAKASEDATLVPVDQDFTTDTKNERFPIKLPSLDKQILITIAFPITFFIGIAAGAVWQSSREPIASIPQAAAAPAAPSSNLEPQIEALSLGLAAMRQSLDDLGNGLGRVRRDIADMRTAEQSLFDKISEPPPRPAATPTSKPATRPSQAPLVR